MDRNARLTVAYDGTEFHGLAESADVRTVMGELRSTIERIVRRPVALIAAGRTDAGVHAWGQVVSGRLPSDTDLERLAHSVNRLCGPEIAIRDAAWVADDFDARFSATARSYRYEVWNVPAPNPLLARTTWHVPPPLALPAMNDAARRLLGEHDFSSFCRRPKAPTGAPERSLVRVVQRARWVRVADSPLVRFEITGSSFCHQMVRSIVGTLVEVGRGDRAADSISSTLAARDRSAAGRVAPPDGLTLWSVDYDGSRWDDRSGLDGDGRRLDPR